MTAAKSIPIGFSGLDTYVSTVDIPSNISQTVNADTVPSGRFAGTSPLPEVAQPTPTLAYKIGKWLRKRWNNASRAEVIFGSILVGYFSLLFVSNINFHNDTSSKPIIPTQGPNVLAKPTAPPPPGHIVVKYFYTLKSSEGNTFELDGPANASEVDLNKTAQGRWRPAQTYYPETRPDIGDGLLFSDNEIRYCSAQKIRMGGWERTVDNYSHESVDAFNSMVKDYNSRCGHFKYQEGALARVQAEVNSRMAQLDVDGRLHRGPRPPPSPPTFRKVSTRTEITFVGRPHPECDNTVDLVKCESQLLKTEEKAATRSKTFTYEEAQGTSKPKP